jgi:glutamyl-tRNA synthetase
MRPFLERDLAADVARAVDDSYLAAIVPLVQERLKLLGEAADLTAFFFQERVEHDAALLVQKGMDAAATRHALEVSLARLRDAKAFDAASLEALLRLLAEELGLKTGQLFGALRVATTGRTAAPPLFQTMEVLGRDRCLERIERAIGALRSST